MNSSEVSNLAARLDAVSIALVCALDPKDWERRDIAIALDQLHVMEALIAVIDDRMRMVEVSAIDVDSSGINQDNQIHAVPRSQQEDT